MIFSQLFCVLRIFINYYVNVFSWAEFMNMKNGPINKLTKKNIFVKLALLEMKLFVLDLRSYTSIILDLYLFFQRNQQTNVSGPSLFINIKKGPLLLYILCNYY